MSQVIFFFSIVLGHCRLVMSEKELEMTMQQRRSSIRIKAGIENKLNHHRAQGQCCHGFIHQRIEL